MNTTNDVCTSPNMSANTAEENLHDILLVDDEPDLLLIVGELLRAHGFHVLTARDGFSAMQQLDSNRVRMLVLDINLAGEDGVRLMTYIKKNNPNLPVLLYTGLSHDEQQVNSMFQKGALCYVNKNQPSAELIFAVRQVLETH